MTIVVSCRCGQRFTTGDEYAGWPAQCPSCGARLTVPQPDSGTEFCDFCHQHIPRSQMAAHLETHAKLQPDGQYTDYATLPSAERASEAEFQNAPIWYTHVKCGQSTGMPEDVTRTYLANPWFYHADRTYCGGCEDHVPFRECVWDDTGENMQTYMNRLRAAKPEMQFARGKRR